MYKKYPRKTLPSSYSANDFIYQGRPAKDQGDFGSDVGLVDMCCVNQFGANNDKFYHAGVCKTPDGVWWLYTEWGRRTPGQSWDGGMPRTDFQFVSFNDETSARKEFVKKAKSKNTSRIVEKSPGIWTAKAGKDGYLVQDLATREKGLPDAYKIKDSSGLKASSKKSSKKKKASKKKTSKSYHPEELSLASALLGGTLSYTKRATAASGVLLTINTITKVRDTLIPEALKEIGRVTKSIPKQRTRESDDSYETRLANACIVDKDLQDLSKMVASLIPMPIPARANPTQRALATILSNSNIQRIQDDLDAFESSLMNEDFEAEIEDNSLDIEKALKTELRWISQTSEEGKWILRRWKEQTKNRHHGYGNLKIKNIFSLSRPRVDGKFVESAKHIHKKREGETLDKADMQPSKAYSSNVGSYPFANVGWMFHGTRSVNVSPILQSDLRLPKSLKGVHITGAAFGNGIYWGSDFRKSAGYISSTNSIYTSGNGSIKGRGAFMFFGEVIMGKPYRATRAWSISNCPKGYDSVFASPRWCSTLQNDEHVVWGTSIGPSHCLRYLLEITE